MCNVKFCKQKDVEVMYQNHNVCKKCWEKHCDNKINLKEELGIKR